MRRMTLWQFQETVDGFVAAQSGKEEGLTDNERDNLRALVSGD